MKYLLGFAWLYGAVPLLLGTIIFVVWLIFRFEILMLAGFVMLIVGLCLILWGLVCLTAYVRHARRSPTGSRRRLAWQVAGVLGLYVANFVAAGSFVYAAYVIETRYFLSITNRGDVPLEGVRVEGGGASVSFGDIATGETVKQSFLIRDEGELVLTARRGEERIESVINGYLIPGFGVDEAVTVDASGEVIVRLRFADGSSGATWQTRRVSTEPLRPSNKQARIHWTRALTSGECSGESSPSRARTYNLAVNSRSLYH